MATRGPIRMKWFSNASIYAIILQLTSMYSYKIEKVYLEIYWKGFLAIIGVSSHVRSPPPNHTWKPLYPTYTYNKKTSEL